uniref:Putative ixodes 8-cys protein n=1 Tax=Ixodes ricinus TaxID=34613 RepID=A0A0K8RBM6_IXORI
MKVVCIILLFVIAAEGESTDERTAVKPPQGKKNATQIKFKYPSYIRHHQAFALKLLDICQKYTPETRRSNDKHTSSTATINDLKVDFKNCTFFCKREFGNVTLPLPKETPCGPNNQTCEKKEDCVAYIPGC